MQLGKDYIYIYVILQHSHVMVSSSTVTSMAVLHIKHEAVDLMCTAITLPLKSLSWISELVRFISFISSISLMTVDSLVLRNFVS